MQAILSDIHGNLEAITAVLADIEQRGVRDVYNLGDTLGYGPDPIACLDLAVNMSLVLKGNFDQAVLTTPEGFCRGAEASILWSQTDLRTAPDPAQRERRSRFLASLSGSQQSGDILYVHGSARNPLNEYVFPEDIYNQRKMTRIGEKFDRICFAGHTHVPGLFLEHRPGMWEFIYYEECERGYPISGRKLICNVGAVGQPRDDDRRACYALFDGERIWFRRVEYDIETTIRKIYAVRDLDNFLGDRLREGR